MSEPTPESTPEYAAGYDSGFTTEHPAPYGAVRAEFDNPANDLNHHRGFHDGQSARRDAQKG